MGILRGVTTPFPAHSSIPVRFAEQVRARHGAVAVVDGEQSLTYAELDERSNRLAQLLRDRGVGAETRVGVLLERGHELVTAVLAVVKAGGAYMPVNPAYPRQRQQEMLADAEATVVVTEEEVRQAAVAGDTPDAALPAVGPDSLAYVLFTSGSTGRPKGVMIEHRSVLRLVCDTDYAELGPDERIAQVADPSFDVFTFEVWGALLNGGTLCVLPPDAILAPGELRRMLAAYRVTTLFLTSALFTEVMADRPDSFGGLRNLFVGGDTVSVSRARQLLESEPSVRPDRFLNAYGPTEATTYATCGLIESVPADATSVPIGGPIANTSCYVLDADLKPVPDGTAGELFIGGPGVARGYVGRPEETQERFLPDPFAAEDGARMYRTGDLVCSRGDGMLAFLGRVDNQVKIRGYRVEPGEVEAVLGAHPDVRQAAVVPDEATGERRLVAHVVPAEPGSTPTGLREFLAGRLPEWLIPSVFVISPSLPFTDSGKVDRAALPPVAANGPDASAVAPRTDLEREVAALAADILGLSSVGLTDDFFALGGHSLLAMRLLSRVNDTFAAEVELGDFLYDPTVLRLAAEVARDR
ncbi:MULTISPECIES: non-ribosomal peptide synthetase [unclassified Streptomyces]|uniref:non-ribosomal peptide synthetase n=1 Tax=unclassified Streptomyces TaxID=2593676 RepID=UPI00236539F9|nr:MULTISPECIES: non-ribosomal peptide synthetase [unclassified Streptomyces]MDF3142961.1 non-ribosomal peptide synthetase [Streptomyces sp. T21Q-yed]WDF42886.1 non-ribosomal peptide synthetase [Streptomyces sp. T12]